MKGLRLFTFVHGEKFIEERFRRTIVRSLAWPQNRAALQERAAVWEIWGRKDEFPFIADAAKDVGISIKLNEADSFLDDLNSKYLGDNGVMMKELFLISARKCFETNSQMLQAPPDTLMGGDAVANILQAGEQEGTVVFCPHLRVLPEIVSAFDRAHARSSVSNSKLVNFALEFAHKSFTEAEFGHERINSYIGGIFWRRRPNGVIAMTHHLSTPYLINWTQADIEYWSRQNPPGAWPPVYGEIDHLYPGVCVFPKERARVIGSSDDVFICEVTDPESNVPPLMNYDKAEADRFWRQEFHNKSMKQFSYTIREEQL